MLSGAKACKSCRSRQELSNEYLVFTCKIRLRFSRERASQSFQPHVSEFTITWEKNEFTSNLQAKGSTSKAIVNGINRASSIMIEAVKHKKKVVKVPSGLIMYGLRPGIDTNVRSQGSRPYSKLVGARSRL